MQGLTRSLKPFICALMLAVVLPACAAVAQTWPSKSIRLVVPYPPGGPTDVLARIYAAKLQEALGKTVVIDNKAGASGQIGAQDVARAAPDGHTLMANASSVVILPHVISNPLYDVDRDFAPVFVMGSVPAILITPASTTANSVAELVAGFKAKGGKTNYGSSSVGGAMHLSGERFRQATGLDMEHIAYKGGGPAINAVITGEVPMSFESLPAAMPFIKSGQLKVLAVSAPKRHPTLPDVPTMIEQGFAGFDLGSWYAIWAPAKTPAAIIERLNAELVAIARMPDVKARFDALGTDLELLSAEEFRVFSKKEFDRWGAIARKAGIRLE